jgi:murein DD-endopeptidase MepM/ murein hydrolase activator NlpD
MIKALINSPLSKLIFFSFILSTCTTSKLAPVEHRGEYFYGFKMEDQGNFRLKHPQFIIASQNDSYKKISRIYNIPLDELLLANNETNKRKLTIGEKIFLPQAAYHTVVHGEDLELISDMYHISQNKIKKTNNLTTAEVQPGQVLRIAIQKVLTINHTSHSQSSEEHNLISPPDSEIREVIVQDLTTRSVHNQLSSQFIWPVKGKIIKNFNTSDNNNRSEGINIEANLHTPILAAEEGKVVYVGSELKGYGKMIIIKHPNGWLSAYAHQNQFNVSKGSLVKKGDIIGFVGDSGTVNSPQLYFAIRKGLQSYDPLELLPK